jgi:steroid delta-isomerase-like uncharacterized protein
MLPTTRTPGDEPDLYPPTDGNAGTTTGEDHTPPLATDRPTRRAVLQLSAGLVAAVVGGTAWGPSPASAAPGQAPRSLAKGENHFMIDENKELVGSWVEVWNSGDLAAIDDLLTPDFVRHDPDAPEVRGPTAEREFVAGYLAAFPDLHFTVESLVAEANLVAARLIATGTHRGDLPGIPATGKTVRIEIMELYRVAEGRIAEQWVLTDMLALLQQIGALPAS